MGFEPRPSRGIGRPGEVLVPSAQIRAARGLLDWPGLLAKNFPTKNDSRVPMTQAEFLEWAWKLANDKARALGWNV